MKSKYVVFRESSCGMANGNSYYRKLKSFRNESDALAFISEPKNIRMYGELFLECHSSDGLCYEWDSSKRRWVLP